MKKSHYYQLGKGTLIKRDRGFPKFSSVVFLSNYRYGLGCGDWRSACWSPKPKASSLAPATLGANYDAIRISFLDKTKSCHFALEFLSFILLQDSFHSSSSCNDIFILRVHKKVLQKAPLSQVYHLKLKPK